MGRREWDAGARDAGAPDAGAPDAGARDAGARDAGARDAGHETPGTRRRARDAGHETPGVETPGCKYGKPAEAGSHGSGYRARFSGLPVVPAGGFNPSRRWRGGIPVPSRSRPFIRDHRSATITNVPSRTPPFRRDHDRSFALTVPSQSPPFRYDHDRSVAITVPSRSRPFRHDHDRSAAITTVHSRSLFRATITTVPPRSRFRHDHGCGLIVCSVPRHARHPYHPRPRAHEFASSVGRPRGGAWDGA